MTGVLGGTGADVRTKTRLILCHFLATDGLLVVPLGGEVVGGGELGWGGHFPRRAATDGSLGNICDNRDRT